MSDLPEGVVGTGVFATDEEREYLEELATKARNTPVIMVGGMDVSGTAWQRVNTACHAAALKHGLPEIKGFYGLGLDGEFIKQADQ